MLSTLNYLICTSYWNNLFYHSVAFEISSRISELKPISTYGTITFGKKMISLIDWFEDTVTAAKLINKKRTHKKLNKMNLTKFTLCGAMLIHMISLGSCAHLMIILRFSSWYSDSISPYPKYGITLTNAFSVSKFSQRYSAVLISSSAT